MHPLGDHASGQQPVTHRVDHVTRPADEGRIDGVGRDECIEEGEHALAVEAAIEQRHVLRLAREHVIQHEARQVAILDVFERLGKDRAVLAAIAIHEREAAARLGLRACVRIDRDVTSA